MVRLAPVFILATACAARTPPVPATGAQPAAADRAGPPNEMVRADLDCPAGDIVYTGGLGTGDRVLVRELQACGKSATYVWSEAGWERSKD